MSAAEAARPSFLLVHGGSHGAWCWEKVVVELARDGWRSVAVDLPTALHDEPYPDPLPGMHDDARHLLDRLAGMDGPVVVVAHSYGGSPTTQAIADAPNVVHVVYLASIPLDVGESMFGYFGLPPTAASEPVMAVPAGGEELFFGDLSEEEAAAAIRRLVPHSQQAGWGEVTRAGWRTVPSSYIVCERDRRMEPRLQEEIAARAGSVIHRIDSSHSPFLSRPAELAAMLAGIATRATA